MYPAILLRHLAEKQPPRDSSFVAQRLVHLLARMWEKGTEQDLF